MKDTYIGIREKNEICPIMVRSQKSDMLSHIHGKSDKIKDKLLFTGRMNRKEETDLSKSMVR
jgi:hypothetical protein